MHHHPPAPLYAPAGTPPQFVPPPRPDLNGGLYTGEPFRPGAPWANVPATPDAGHLMYGPLLAAVLPPGAEHHVPGGGWRPGNNTPLLPLGAARRESADLSLTCAPPPRPQAPPSSLRKYAPF